jgi:hypothetical protein
MTVPRRTKSSASLAFTDNGLQSRRLQGLLWKIHEIVIGPAARSRRRPNRRPEAAPYWQG